MTFAIFSTVKINFDVYVFFTIFISQAQVMMTQMMLQSATPIPGLGRGSTPTGALNLPGGTLQSPPVNSGGLGTFGGGSATGAGGLSRGALQSPPVNSGGGLGSLAATLPSMAFPPPGVSQNNPFNMASSTHGITTQLAGASSGLNPAVTSFNPDNFGSAGAPGLNPGATSYNPTGAMGLNPAAASFNSTGATGLNPTSVVGYNPTSALGSNQMSQFPTMNMNPAAMSHAFGANTILPPNTQPLAYIGRSGPGVNTLGGPNSVRLTQNMTVPPPSLTATGLFMGAPSGFGTQPNTTELPQNYNIVNSNMATNFGVGGGNFNPSTMQSGQFVAADLQTGSSYVQGTSAPVVMMGQTGVVPGLGRGNMRGGKS